MIVNDSQKKKYFLESFRLDLYLQTILSYELNLNNALLKFSLLNLHFPVIPRVNPNY